MYLKVQNGTKCLRRDITPTILLIFSLLERDGAICCLQVAGEDSIKIISCERGKRDENLDTSCLITVLIAVVGVKPAVNYSSFV